MTKSVCLFCFVITLLFCISLDAVSQFRTIEGDGNNLLNPEWGARHGVLVNSCRIGFQDGIEEPNGGLLPSPRRISNEIFDQPTSISSTIELNDLFWAFGQFIDHDLVLTHDNETEPLPIAIPAGDPLFDPSGSGQMSIMMHRSLGEIGDSGVREYQNEITSFIDGSMIYGSTVARADYLRSFIDGKLRTTQGELPIFNTLTGEYGAPVDADAPVMAGASRGGRVFVCGDERANENSLLASFHALWVREHNRICDSLSALDPTIGDEDLYQHSRALVGAMLQHITYAEWLPHLGIDISTGLGYDPMVNPSVSNEFASAGFRFGHTLVGSEIVLLDDQGVELADSPMSLREVFFDPLAVVRENGIDALLKGAASHQQQDLDARVVDDLRNFLFGAPGSGGMDLSAININRGRDRGVASFNQMREDLGLFSYASFEDFLSGEELDRVKRAYDRVDDLEAWVGLLLECNSGLPGETLSTILNEQFVRLQRGDKFFYTHSGQFNSAQLSWIRNQSLARVINRNSSANLDNNSFKVQRVSSVSAYAKTDNSKIRIARGGSAVFITGLDDSVTYGIELIDGLGRSLIGRQALVVNSFGESRIDLSKIQRTQSILAVSILKNGKRCASEVVGL